MNPVQDADASPLSPFPGRLPVPLLERLTLLGCLIGLYVPKIHFNLKTRALGIDGGLYFDVAMNVRDGQGLVSDIALFNSAFTDLPHPTVLYPLWPMMLGWMARFFPLWELSIWLPTVLFGVSLLLLYRLVNRLFPGPIFPDVWVPLNAGHAAVMIFGSAEAYMIHTSRPFSEGLAFVILFLTLLRVKSLFEKVSPYLGFEVGIWLGLLVLARSQLILVWMALFPVLLLRLLGSERRRWWLPTTLLLIGLGLVIGEQLLFFATFMPDPAFLYLMRFDLFRDPSPLHVVPVLVQTNGLWDYLQDRAAGIPIAFGVGRKGYVHSFGPISMVLPLSLPFALLGLMRWVGPAWTRFQARPSFWSWLKEQAIVQEKYGYWVFLGLMSLGGFLSLHTIHKANFAEWNFGTRHALTAFFLFFAVFLGMTRQPVLGRSVALVLLVASTGINLDHASDRVKRQKQIESTWQPELNRDIVAFLERIQLQEPRVRVIAPDMRIQRFGAFTSGIGYYWMYQKTTLEELDYLCHELGARYLLLPSSMRADSGGAYTFLRNSGLFFSKFARIKQGISGLDVFVPREQLGERVELHGYSLDKGASASQDSGNEREDGL